MEAYTDDNASGKFGAPSSASRHHQHSPNIYPRDSPLTTLDEVHNEHHERSGMTNMTRSVSTILNTVENIQAAAEEFNEHITMLNSQFKQEVLAKIKDLKHADTQLLTERVSTKSYLNA